eukprot:scpid37993/ scgid15972/ Fibrillin-1; MP340
MLGLVLYHRPRIGARQNTPKMARHYTATLLLTIVGLLFCIQFTTCVGNSTMPCSWSPAFCLCPNGYFSDGGVCRRVGPSTMVCSWDTEFCLCPNGYFPDGIICRSQVRTSTTPCSRPPLICLCPKGYFPDRSVCRKMNPPCSAATNCQIRLVNGTKYSKCYSGYVNTAAGFGANCTNVNECLTLAHTCNDVAKRGAHRECVDTSGSYQCPCKSGYAEAGPGGACVDKDECAVGVAVRCSGGTSASASIVCVNTAGSYRCECRAGFANTSSVAGNGSYRCRDVDECGIPQLGACSSIPGSRCVNNVGSYTCACADGYFSVSLPLSSRTGKKRLIACVDKIECRKDVCNQTLGGQCVNTPGSFRCVCPSGLASKATSPGCYGVDECSTGVHRCSSTG